MVSNLELLQEAYNKLENMNDQDFAKFKSEMDEVYISYKLTDISDEPFEILLPGGFIPMECVKEGSIDYNPSNK